MVLSFEEVSYSYRDRGMIPVCGLDGLTLELKEGRMTAILGASGSGKSTLLQHMNGLLRAERGRIRILDCNLDAGQAKTPGMLRRRVGLVFQYPEQQLFEETVLKDLLFGPLNFGWGEDEALRAAHKAAALVGLEEELLERSPFRLSSGQMRKAAVAAVLAADPEVVALDEPTSSLDPASREEMMRMLHGLTRNHRKTVIVVTHRVDEILTFADDIVLLKSGKVLYQGTAAALASRPELFEAAGLHVPSSVRMACFLGKLFGSEADNVDPDPAALADWCAKQLER